MLPLLHPAATSARASMSGCTCRIRNKESVCLSGCVAAVSAGAHRASCGGTRTSPLLEPSAKANAAKAKSRIAWRGAGRRMMRDGAPRRAAEAMRAASREKRKRLLGGEGSACCKFCEEVQCHGASGSPSSSSALSMAASMWITTGLLPVILAGTWKDMTVNTE